MHLKKILLIVFSLFFCVVIHAQETNEDAEEDEKSFHFFMGGGNEYLKNMRLLNLNNSNYIVNRFITANAFYSLFETDLGSPIIGLGINSSYVNKNDSNFFYNTDLTAGIGFKFDLYQELSIYTVGNFSFGLDNKYKDNQYILPFFTKYSGGLMFLVSYTIAQLIHIGIGGQVYKNYFTVVFQNQTEEKGTFDSGYLMFMIGFSL
ncbi:MAG: hypothetical protein DCC88_04090 [Spirobacillus cienkowskii]|uniref:Outer membrane protein beta-barrel domain-containing protein n=1 Tax=Spirobacillus cienkowskii TaxID=495820 RepID=A0A369KY12_9BACT|nr:MAG: hypothetical protein DCC88_04090 [Spirobacillus cienkowskii]